MLLMSYAARTRCIPAVIHNVKAIKNHLVVDSDSGGIRILKKRFSALATCNKLKSSVDEFK